MDFRDGRYVSTIWFIAGEDPITGDGVDWLATVSRDPGEDWKLEYRFRYDAGTGDMEDDRKSWYGGAMAGATPEADVVQNVDAIAGIISLRFKGPIHKLLVRSDRVAVAMEALGREEWAHIRKMTKEEYEADQKGSGGDNDVEG